LPDAVSASSRSAELQFPIHSQAAVNFWANEIYAKSCVTIVLQHRYMPEFVVLPPPLYHEPNNKSFGHSMGPISGVGAGGVCGTIAGTCPLLQPVRSGCEI